MKQFITTIQHIWKIEELRNRILFTLGMLFVFRVGSFIPLPGVDPNLLEQATAASSGNDLLSLLNMFTGGAFNNGAI